MGDPLALWINRLTRRSVLSAADVAQLQQLPHRVMRFQRHQDVVREGEFTQEACLIVEGRFGRYRQDAAGVRQICALHLPGDMADLHSVMLPLANSAITAMSDGIVWRIPHEAIRALTRNSSAIAEACWRDTLVDAQLAVEGMFVLGRLAARGKCAHLLCELSYRLSLIGERADRFELDLTQELIGELLGLTSVHVNRTLRDLRMSGLIQIEKKQVVILDADGLAREGQFNPRYLHLATRPAG